VDAELDVVRHAEMGKQRVVLKHHADAALLGCQVHAGGGVGECVAGDHHAPLGAAFQPGHGAQQ